MSLSDWQSETIFDAAIGLDPLGTRAAPRDIGRCSDLVRDNGLSSLSSRPMRRTAVRLETELAWRFDIDGRNFGAGKPNGKCHAIYVATPSGSAEYETVLAEGMGKSASGKG